MKNTLMLTIVFMMSISIFGQGSKFTYERTSTGSFFVRPNFKEHEKEHTIGAVGYFKDEKWIANSLDSVARSAIPKNKWDELKKQSRKGAITIDYLPSGQVYSLWFWIPYDYKKILSDQDFYNLYISIKSFRMDMSKIKLECPTNQTPGTKFIWSISTSFPVPERYK
jgi:hypothetical protein